MFCYKPVLSPELSSKQWSQWSMKLIMWPSDSSASVDDVKGNGIPPLLLPLSGVICIQIKHQFVPVLDWFQTNMYTSLLCSVMEQNKFLLFRN